MTRPDPLVPAECSMAGNEWFPFYFDRVRKSKWWRRATDVARARNVMMWGEAFKAAPAGSLPDDDDELAEAAGYGMDIDAFLAVKGDIMAPWVLCSDGRWYHPTVCEVVLDAWERSSERKKAAAERQRRRRDKVRGVTPKIADVTPQSREVTGESASVTRDTAENERDFGIQDRTGQDSTEPPLPPEGESRGDLERDGGKPEARRKPKRPIPDGYPDAAAIAEQQGRARDAGKNVDIANQADRFRNWALGKDARYVDWAATWRNWADRTIREAPAAYTPAASPSAQVSPDDLWRRRIQAYRRNAYWNRLEWGPAPGQPGCKVSPEIQRECGIEPAKPQPIRGAA